MARLDWCEYMICGVISETNETMESCWNMAFRDLMTLKEYNECKSFIETVANNIQNDEIDKINKKK